MLATHGGRRIEIRHPGRWKLLGGPDFRDARIRFDDGAEVIGDFELHLNADGWAAHGHASDSAYDRIVLHGVLSPPEAGHVTRTRDGRSLPMLVLLPLLHHNLEQFGAEDAIETLASRPASRMLAELAPLQSDELAALLRRFAAQRWQQKLRFARIRVERLGWSAACHQAALEILGYPSTAPRC